MNDRSVGLRRRSLLALAVGYAALAGAALSAYTASASGFELSIYEGTPLSVWVLLGVALTLSLLVSFQVSGTRLGTAGLLLGGGSVGLVTALPLVRGYRFYGAGDGLTHVGWAADAASGTLNPFGLFYPALHTLTVFFAELLGIGVMRAMLLVVLAITLSFPVFVPLCVGAITGYTEAAYVGAFVAFCLLPINHIATHYMEPHPATQAVLLSPLVLYLLVQYVLCEFSLLEAPLTRTGTLLALGAVSLVLYHPQQAANTLILFATVAAVQAGCRLLRCGGEIRAHRPLYVQTIWLGLFFAGWAAGREKFAGALNSVTSELAGYLLAGSTDAASVVSQRGSSLGQIGASTGELFAKLLFVPTVFAALTAVVMTTSLLGRSETTEPETTALLRYFSAGLFVLVPYSLVFFVGSVSKLFFRNLGFVMVLVSIVGAIALFRLRRLLADRFSPAVGYPAMTLFLGAALVLSMVVVFPSPYVYVGSGHVSDDRLAGYETAFSHQAPDTAIYGVRGGPWRYRQATVGVTGVATSRYEDRAIWGETLSRVRALAEEDRYFLLTDPDVRLEAGVYEGLRYSKAQFRSLSRQPGVHIVQYNGEATVYRIEARPPPASRRPAPRNADGSPNGSRTPAGSARPEGNAPGAANGSRTPTAGPNASASETRRSTPGASPADDGGSPADDGANATSTPGSSVGTAVNSAPETNGTAGSGPGTGGSNESTEGNESTNSSTGSTDGTNSTDAPGPPPGVGNETNASSPGGSDRPGGPSGENTTVGTNGTSATNETAGTNGTNATARARSNPGDR
jgi:hypothetical protein